MVHKISGHGSIAIMQRFTITLLFLSMYFDAFGLEYPTACKDVNYAGESMAFHNMEIYLPAIARKTYPVVVSIYASAWFGNNLKGFDLRGYSSTETS